MPGRPIAFFALAAALLAVFVTPTAASAATEIGDDCAANLETGTFTNVPESKATGASPLPVSAPAAGVLTSWKMKSLAAAPSPVWMGVFRLTGPGKFLVAGASIQETAAFGPNTFKTRIPVQAGDRFGALPVDGRYFACLTGNDDDQSWSSSENVEVGGAYQFAAGVGVRVPIIGVIEPDVDGDGYGDETQDGCPRSESTFAPCPLVTTSFTTEVKKKTILVSVTVSSEATVQVFGQVSWPVRGAPKVPHSSKRPANHVLIAGISAGRPRLVAPGETKVFRAQLTKPILRRLGRIGPKQALRPLMTARTTDIAAKITDERKRIKLRGREGT